MSTDTTPTPANPVTNPALFYTVSETVNALRVSRQTLYRMFNDCELKSKKVRGRRLVSHAELSRLVGGEA